jgi:uncharacterized membrane-anchored protein YhcB (DUF1043 family)
MSKQELWFWFGIAVVAGITITRVVHDLTYYRYESKRQIELAKAGFDPDTKEEA